MAKVAPTEQKTKKPHRGWVWTLIVLATLVVFVSSLTIFVRRQALNSQAVSNASVSMLQDQQIRDALSIYMVNELYSSVDVEAQLQSLLPKGAQSLAGPAAGLLQQVAPRAASEVLARPRVQAAFRQAVLRTHQQFMEIINGKKTGVVQTTQQGQVVLDLHPLVQTLADRLGVGANVKPDAGRLVVFTSSQLKLVQDVVKVIKVLSVFLVILALVLYGLAIWLARGWRREVLRAIGWGLVIVGVLLIFVRRYTENSLVDSLIKNPVDRTAGKHAWLIASSLLADIAWAIIFYGIALVVASWLAGPSRWATSFREWLAPIFREHPGYVWGGVAFLYLLLLLWGPTPAMHKWWGILIFGGLIALGVEYLRRATLEEFPDTTPAPAPPAEPTSTS